LIITEPEGIVLVWANDAFEIGISRNNKNSFMWQKIEIFRVRFFINIHFKIVFLKTKIVVLKDFY
jgi:hypothetical protein